MPSDYSSDDVNRFFLNSSHSVGLINEIINGNYLGNFDTSSDVPQDEKNKIVNKNVIHLEIIQSKDWYVDDSQVRESPANKTSISDAIAAGKTYLTNNGFSNDN